MAMLLNDLQIKALNDIFVRTVRKYTSGSSDSIHIGAAVQITPDEAAALAEFELGKKRTRILENYRERIEAINTNAIKRGMNLSSIVLEQLDRALVQKTDALNALDEAAEKIAKKILADNQKLALGIERERTNSKSRTLRDYVAFSRMKLTVPFDLQSTVNDELYLAYLEWLMQFPPADGLSYIESNAVFTINLGSSQFMKLRTEMLRRAGRIQ